MSPKRAAGKAKAAPKVKAKAKARVRQVRLRRPAAGVLRRPEGREPAEEAPVAAAPAENFKQGRAVPLHSLPLETFKVGSRIVISEGSYYSGPCQLAGRVRELNFTEQGAPHSSGVDRREQRGIAEVWHERPGQASGGSCLSRRMRRRPSWSELGAWDKRPSSNSRTRVEANLGTESRADRRGRTRKVERVGESRKRGTTRREGSEEGEENKKGEIIELFTEGEEEKKAKKGEKED